MPSAIPRIGVPSGAMIIAPITVAVESASTPLMAMIADSTSMMRKPVRFASGSPYPRSSASFSASTGWRWVGGMSV